MTRQVLLLVQSLNDDGSIKAENGKVVRDPKFRGTRIIDKVEQLGQVAKIPVLRMARADGFIPQLRAVGDIKDHPSWTLMFTVTPEDLIQDKIAIERRKQERGANKAIKQQSDKATKPAKSALAPAWCIFS